MDTRMTRRTEWDQEMHSDHALPISSTVCGQTTGRTSHKTAKAINSESSKPKATWLLQATFLLHALFYAPNSAAICSQPIETWLQPLS